ncbi:sporulation protein [Catellatospora sp. NPDC049133]|uniref:sporulation protein n=1 Tax=Catellatospora sp. NPDC049133 TaxID=3155499 RepID=UPI0033D59948
MRKPTLGGQLGGQVNLRAKSDTDITMIWLLLVASTPFGETELARQQVAGGLRVLGGSSQSVPFTFTVPALAPVTNLYGQNLPGGGIGLRTEVAVASGTQPRRPPGTCPPSQDRRAPGHARRARPHRHPSGRTRAAALVAAQGRARQAVPRGRGRGRVRQSSTPDSPALPSTCPGDGWAGIDFILTGITARTEPPGHAGPPL